MIRGRGLVLSVCSFSLQTISAYDIVDISPQYKKGDTTMEFNDLITAFSSYVPATSSFLAQTIVSAFISAIFSHRSDKKTIIHGAKVDFFEPDNKRTTQG